MNACLSVVGSKIKKTGLCFTISIYEEFIVKIYLAKILPRNNTIRRQESNHDNLYLISFNYISSFVETLGMFERVFVSCSKLCFQRFVRTNPANIYFFKVNNRNTRKRCEICSKFTIKKPQRRH